MTTIKSCILLVDDDPKFISKLKEHLGTEHRVVSTSDSTAAARYAAQYRPDVMLLDLNMPRLVRNAVTYGPGAEAGAMVPDVSSPCLRAELVPEHREDNGRKLIEKHREWRLDCDVQFLGISKPGGKSNGN